MKEQARQMIKSGLEQLAPWKKPKESLAEAIRSIFEPLGGVDLKLPPRDYGRDPPTFD